MPSHLMPKLSTTRLNATGFHLRRHRPGVYWHGNYPNLLSIEVMRSLASLLDCVNLHITLKISHYT